MDKPKWTDVAIVILTAGIVYLAFMQWNEMHESGGQMERQIGTLKQQMSATAVLAIEAKDQADRTKDLAARMKDQADRTRDLANTSRAELVDVQRAHIFVHSVDTTVGTASNGAEAYSWTLTAENSGFTNARGLQLRRYCGTAKQLHVSPSEWLDFSKFLLEPQNLSIGPHATQSTANCAALASVVLEPNAGPWYIFGRFTYSDIFGGSHVTEFCYSHSFKMPQLGEGFDRTLYMAPCDGVNSKHNCTDEDCQGQRQN